MKTYQANLLNAIILIVMPIWAYLTFEGSVEKPEQSITAFIPLFFGVILLICNKGLKNESKLTDDPFEYNFLENFRTRFSKYYNSVEYNYFR